MLVRRSAVSALLALVVSAAAGLVLSPAAQAAVGDVGTPGPSFSATAAGGSPTGEKPESKLWFHAGSWWGSLLAADGTGYRIHRLDRARRTWVDTGVRLDDRPASRADVLWSGSTLYVASHAPAKDSLSTSAGQPARLYRFGWNATAGTWEALGAPTAINDVSSETLTIDRDSTGRLWATWTQAQAVQVAVSTDDGRTWTTSALPAAGAGDLAADDISSLVSYGSGSTASIGVMWSNQVRSAVFFAARADGAALGTWDVSRTAVQGPNTADDHVNLKSLQGDAAGRVFAVVKTSLEKSGTTSAPQNLLLVRDPGTGEWTSTKVGTVAECHTRPVLVVDTARSQLHVFATAPTADGCPFSGAAGTVYRKSASLSSPVFAAGRGEPVMRDTTSENINNVTTTKQSATSASGVVVLASDTTTGRYWYADMDAAAPQATTAAFTPSTTSGPAPLAVGFTNTSTGATSYAWDFGDGTSSTLAQPSHTFTAPGSYVVRLTASGAGGTSSATSTITATSSTAGPAQAAFTASTTSGPAPLTVAFTDTSTGSPTEWWWEFGDDTYDRVQNPSHTYSTPGTYTVGLWAKNAYGATHLVKTDLIQVTSGTTTPPSAPRASFTASTLSGRAPLDVAFTDTSTGSPTAWRWDFGNGTTSTLRNPTARFAAGTWTVRLTVSNAAGSSSATTTITVKKK